MAGGEAGGESGLSVPLNGGSGPRWNRAKPIYPSHVHTWLDCPRRCRLRYIDRVPGELRWDRKIEVGNALHKVMEEIANILRARAPLPEIEHWRPRAERLLPEAPYIDAPELTLQDRAEDIDNVLRWAAKAQAYINDPAATIIRIENYYPRDWQHAELGQMKLAAKSDLVLRRQDERGPYVEIVDYKTGRWKRPVDFAPALARISHKPQVHAALAERGFPRVRFTYLWLARQECEQIDMTREHMEREWGELQRVLQWLLNEEDWPMRPGPKTCRICPYYQIACHPTIPDS